MKKISVSNLLVPNFEHLLLRIAATPHFQIFKRNTPPNVLHHESLPYRQHLFDPRMLHVRLLAKRRGRRADQECLRSNEVRRQMEVRTRTLNQITSGSKERPRNRQHLHLHELLHRNSLQP